MHIPFLLGDQGELDEWPDASHAGLLGVGGGSVGFCVIWSSFHGQKGKERQAPSPEGLLCPDALLKSRVFTSQTQTQVCKNAALCPERS